jgi:hypothetical protein
MCVRAWLSTYNVSYYLHDILLMISQQVLMSVLTDLDRYNTDLDFHRINPYENDLDERL